MLGKPRTPARRMVRHQILFSCSRDRVVIVVGDPLKLRLARGLFSKLLLKNFLRLLARTDAPEERQHFAV